MNAYRRLAAGIILLVVPGAYSLPQGPADGVNCEELGAGRKNLKNRDVASYLRVWKDTK